MSDQSKPGNRIMALEKRLTELKVRGVLPVELIRVEFQDVDFLVKENKELHERLKRAIKRNGSTVESENAKTLSAYLEKHPQKAEALTRILNDVKGSEQSNAG